MDSMLYTEYRQCLGSIQGQALCWLQFYWQYNSRGNNIDTPADRGTIKCNSVARQRETQAANWCCWRRLLKVKWRGFWPLRKTVGFVHLQCSQSSVVIFSSETCWRRHGGQLKNVFVVAGRLWGDKTLLMDLDSKRWSGAGSVFLCQDRAKTPLTFKVIVRQPPSGLYNPE